MKSPMLLVLFVALAFFTASVDGFASYANLVNIARLFAPLLIASVGLTFVFLIGGIDLSIGSTVSFASIICAFVTRDTDSIALGGLAGVSTGLAIGAINGVAISFFRLPAFVHTLAMLLTVRAVGLLITGGFSVGHLPIEAMMFGRQSLLGVPNLLWIGLGVVVLAQIILSFTRFGREIYLIGTSERAATFNGIHVQYTRFLAHTICGALAGLCGVTIVLRLGSGGPVLGDNLLLMAIAAVVLGGTSIMGGEGSAMRTVVGAALIILLDKGLNMLGFSFYDQAVVMGVVLILGSAFSRWLHKRLGQR
jgi:ribose/xylose/arabinose/galactoside ABC-type transport system permease subunit